MTPVTPSQKLAAAGRVAMRQAGQSRLLRGLSAGAQAAFGSMSRALRLLLLEVFGFLFLIFALVGSYALLREYRAWAAGNVGPGKVAMAAVFTLMFAWFGVSSFWRAWKK